MLNRHTLKRPRHGQRGVVMMVALVILVVMTLAGISLMRSMDTTNLIAGNMAFKQAATQSSDVGVEAAISWLEANNAGSFLDNSNQPAGYTASTPNNAALALGEAFWNGLAASGVCNLDLDPATPVVFPRACVATPKPNASGNSVSYMIQRLCAATGNRNGAGCSIVAGAIVASGNNEGAGEEQLTGQSTAVYYRITVRVVGPRNAVSFVQAIVSL
ncbi:MAG: hypothetical protein ACK4F4_04570 [Hylemonella sp.]|uniref:pilus assembly PilX family protein n=1 Tax=Hylemonella sp. TaxID=2066020 RepID=UPI00391A6F04